MPSASERTPPELSVRRLATSTLSGSLTAMEPAPCRGRTATKMVMLPPFTAVTVQLIFVAPWAGIGNPIIATDTVPGWETRRTTAYARIGNGDPELGRWLTEDVPAALIASEPLPQRPASASPGRSRRANRR